MQVPSSREPHPVALAPDARVHVEVRLAIALVAGVVPEADGHRRHRLADHQLPELADHLAAVEVERRGVDAQPAPRHLAPHDGRQRAAGDDRAADVGAAAAVDQQHVRPELLVEVVVALGGQRRSRDRHDADAREVEVAAGLQTRLAAGHQERGAHAHHGRPRLLGQPPLLGEVRPGRIAVEHHDRAAQQQRRHERVPHHPRRRREPQQPPAGLEIPAQPEVLDVLDEDAAVTVHDRLRQPGRARREEHVEGVVERHGLELERPGLAQQIAPAVGVIAVRHLDHVLDRRQPRRDRGDLRPAVDARLPERVAIDRRAAPWARSARAGRSRCGRRTRATTLAQIAPRLAVARNATSVSGMFGRYATTRSPRPTPSRCRPARARATWSRNSPKVSSIGPRVFERATTATASGSSPNMCSA